jgi:BirA family biotin operon repressor/biotin-[acetyl-CoA-carboxylase] ligase
MSISMTVEKRILSGLSTSIFGNYIYHFDQIDSTNTHAVKLAREGAPEGTVVIADYQSSGKGRLQNEWISDRGKNLLISIVLRPQIAIEHVQKITLAAADIVLCTLENICTESGVKRPQFTVKWPNDILVGNRKICGILTESAIRARQADYVVVGIGVNVNQKIELLPAELQETTTSLIAETGVHFDVSRLAAMLINDFEAKYFELERNNYSSVINDWREHCPQFGSPIIVETALGSFEAVFEDVSENGVLIYRTSEGERKELVAGSIRRKR